MNLQTLHYFFIFFSSMATGLPLLSESLPAQTQPYIKAAAAVFGLLAFVTGAFAPSMSKTTNDAETLKAAAKLGAVKVAGAAIVVAALALSVSACSLFTPANLPTTVIDATKVACIIENAFVDDAKLNAICGLVTAEEKAAAKSIAEAHRAALGKEMKGMRDVTCDGGAAK